MTTIDTLATIEAELRPAVEAICIAEQRPVCRIPPVVPWRGKGINAKNTGYIIRVREGAIEKLPADELAFVVAHEMAHSLDPSKDESAADAMAVRITYGAGFDPLAGAALMRRLGGPVTTLAWLTGGFMHYPSQGARARRIEALSKENN
jgi:Zn-dependent protease with chaperone function